MKKGFGPQPARSLKRSMISLKSTAGEELGPQELLKRIDPLASGQREGRPNIIHQTAPPLPQHAGAMALTIMGRSGELSISP